MGGTDGAGGAGHSESRNREHAGGALEVARGVPPIDILPACEAVSFGVESEPDPSRRGFIRGVTRESGAAEGGITDPPPETIWSYGYGRA